MIVEKIASFGVTYHYTRLFMKRSFLSIVIFLVAATSLNAQVKVPGDAAALSGLLIEFLDGAGRNDAAVHDRFWADDLIYTRSAGVRINKERFPAPHP